jgi:2,4-dienoyl-CoA reductase-like NADH-dependent reductase (Old Yellow Enzyme family)
LPEHENLGKDNVMAALFEKTVIKSLEISNRSVRSATWEGAADSQGSVTDRVVAIYDNLAAGDIGLIVSGFQYVMTNGIAISSQVGNYSEAQLPGLTRLAATAHSHGAKIIAQLVHGGSKADPGLFPEEGDIWAPCSVPDPWTGKTPREMTCGEITTMVEAYAGAASRAQRAGFDGIQLHGAHGYGINQFLSGASNRRTDRYGGEIGNRYRFLGELLEAVKGTVGRDYPIFIKLSGNDFYEGGLAPEESLRVGQRLAEDGADCIEVSAGSKASANGMVPSRMNIHREEDEAYLSGLSGYFRGAIRIPVITVGGIRSPGVIEKILSQGLADYVALSRPFIREPELIKRWRSGDLRKSACVSCNGCYETGLQGFGISCKLEKRFER